MSSRRKALIALSVLAGSAVCLGLCLVLGFSGFLFAAPTLYRGLLNRSSLAVGEPAPDFELTTLDGDTLRLSDYRGRPVLLTLGASWCIDCRREAPLLQALHERDSGLVVLMVDTKEPRSAVQAYADEFGLTFPIALDPDGRVARLYRVWAIPTELLIDADGIIRARIIESVTQARLDAMLAEAGLDP